MLKLTSKDLLPVRTGAIAAGTMVVGMVIGTTGRAKETIVPVLLAGAASRIIGNLVPGAFGAGLIESGNAGLAAGATILGAYLGSRR